MHASTHPRSELDGIQFHPPRSLGVIIGAAITAWALVLAALCISVAWNAPAEFKTFLAWFAAAVLVLLALLFGSWTYAVATLTYTIARDALVIQWGLRRVVIPIENIQRMVPGRTIDEASVEGVNWWGLHVGVADVKRIGYTLFYSTHKSPDELLFVITEAEAYALTVLDQAAFAEAVQARASVGPVDFTVHRAVATGMAALPFWRDRVAVVAAGLAALGCAVLAGYVFGRYPSLPDVVQINYPELGGIVRIGDKSQLLRLAQVGFGITALNIVLGVLIHSRERAAGLWLLVSAGMLQVILLAAAIAAFERA